MSHATTNNVNEVNAMREKVTDTSYPVSFRVHRFAPWQRGTLLSWVGVNQDLAHVRAHDTHEHVVHFNNVHSDVLSNLMGFELIDREVQLSPEGYENALLMLGLAWMGREDMTWVMADLVS